MRAAGERTSVTRVTPRIPDAPEEFTAEWFCQVLGACAPGVEVSAACVLDQHAGTTGRVRVALDYAGSARGPRSVFVNLPPFDPEQRAIVELTGMGRREARFYAELAESYCAMRSACEPRQTCPGDGAGLRCAHPTGGAVACRSTPRC